jgi:hypothetical protein
LAAVTAFARERVASSTSGCANIADTTWNVVQRVGGLGVGVWGLGSGVWGLGSGVWNLGFRVLGLGFGVWDLGFGGRE